MTDEVVMRRNSLFLYFHSIFLAANILLSECEETSAIVDNVVDTSEKGPDTDGFESKLK